MVLAFNFSANISSMRIASVKKSRESGMPLSRLTATILIAQLAIKR
jgi:amino acid permease